MKCLGGCEGRRIGENVVHDECIIFLLYGLYIVVFKFNFDAIFLIGVRNH